MVTRKPNSQVFLDYSKDKTHYMNIDYDIIIDKLSAADGGGYLAYYKDILSIMGDGETKDEAIDDVKKAFGCFLEVNMEC